MRYLRWLLGFLLLLLVISLPSRDPQSSADGKLPEYERVPLPDRDYVYYTVQPGDNLDLLQRKFRVPSRDAILNLNPELDSDRLPVSTRIKIPLQ